MESSSVCDVHPPVRSISLPTRIHPTSVKLESALNHLKTWKISTPVIGPEVLQNGLVGLAEMYNCIEEFINSSAQTQQALVRHEKGQLVEEALDKSVTLIDTCSSTRDLLLSMKENVHTLQSALRRRGSRDSSIEKEIASYITFRKKMKKDISKSLQALKKLESKNKILADNIADHDQHLSFTIKVLGEATAITISIFRSLLIFLSTPATANKTKLGGWLLISKLMKTRLLSSSSDDQKMINQVVSVDFSVYSLHGSSRSSTSSNGDKTSEVNMTQKMLESLTVSIEGLETGVDSMFKCLVQNRVSFLNILTN